jgi:hypothetical protein
VEKLTHGNDPTECLKDGGITIINKINSEESGPLINHHEDHHKIDLELSGLQNVALGFGLVVLVGLIALLVFRLIVVILSLFPPLFTF